jgi:inorganic pyrophosphatase/exopolyphosphatase
MTTFVIGHNSPDIDSIACAIMEAKILNNKGTLALPKRAKGDPVKGVDKMLNFCSFKMPEKLKDASILNPVVLVDYNLLENGVGEFKNIIEVIDHHQKQEWVEKFENKTIIKLGAAATLTANRCMNEFELSKNEARLLLFAIMADSANLKSQKTKQEDIDTAKKLAKLGKISIRRVKRLVDKWSSFKFNKKYIKTYVNEDVKRGQIEGKVISTAVILTKNYKPFLKKAKLIEDSLKDMIRADIKLLCICDIKNASTVLIHNKKINLPSPYYIKEHYSRNMVKALILEKM